MVPMPMLRFLLLWSTYGDDSTEQLSFEISFGNPTCINNSAEQKRIEGLCHITPLQSTLSVSRDKLLSQCGRYPNWGHMVMSCLQLHVYAATLGSVLLQLRGLG